MKRFLSIVLFMLIGITSVFAKENNYNINFDGERYNLLYSVKNKEFGGYLNEYYKNGETYHRWTEMVAVHHFPNVYSPIDQVKQFEEYLKNLNCPCEIYFDDKEDAAMIDFEIIDDKKVPVVLEYNVFKYQKSEKNGSVAVQYTKRYVTTTALQLKQAKNDIEKHRKKSVKEVKSYKIPLIVTEEIDKCKLASNLIEDKQAAEELSVTAVTEELESVIKEDMEEIKLTEGLAETTEIETIPEKTTSENSSSDETEVKISENDIIPNVPIPTEEELIQKQPQFSYDYKETANTETSKKAESKIDTENKAEKKVKNKKTETYQVINSKEDFYSKPAKRKNISPKKAAKQRAKEAAKKLQENL